MSGTLKYEPALDGLRAYAVLAVMLAHAFPQWPGGWIGVELFFVLSGYLITRLLISEQSATGRPDLLRFYLRRAMRLMPALWLMLAVLAVLFLASSHAPRLMWGWLMSATYLMNWNRAFGWGPDEYLGHTWSLAIEEQFYFLWPLLFLLIRRQALFFIAAMLAAAVAWRTSLVLNGAEWTRIYNGFDTHADPLLIGCALAFIRIPDARRSALSYTLPFIIGGIIAASLVPPTATTMAVGIPLLALLNATLIVASKGGLLNKALTLSPLVFTGKISYGLYLWHYPLLMIAHYRAPDIHPLLVLVATYAVATVSWFTVERYFRRLKSRMDRPAIAAQPA